MLSADLSSLMPGVLPFQGMCSVTGVRGGKDGWDTIKFAVVLSWLLNRRFIHFMLRLVVPKVDGIVFVRCPQATIGMDAYPHFMFFTLRVE